MLNCSPRVRSAIAGFPEPAARITSRADNLEETLPAVGVSRPFASAVWVSMKGLCLHCCRPGELPQRSHFVLHLPAGNVFGQSECPQLHRSAGPSSPVLAGS